VKTRRRHEEGRGRGRACGIRLMWYSFLICRQQELDGKIEDALMGYMDALELMDSELELHLKILKLGKKMNLHP